MDDTAIIIPSRYNSSRLEGKPLLKVKGKSIIEYVYNRAIQVKNANTVIIATDDKRIYDEAKSFNANVEMTKDTHLSGSERICEVALRHPEFKYIINLQGDEPLINVNSIENLIETLKNENETQIVTLIRPIESFKELNNPNIVKCIFNVKNEALYFSRSTIPFAKNIKDARSYAHIGIYGYKRDALIKMVNLKPCFLEQIESLEQLRAIYYNIKISVVKTSKSTVGIDTIEDFEEFKRIIENNDSIYTYN